MNDSLTLQDFLQRMNPRQMLAPMLIVMILSMMVLPLPAFALDVLLTFNITLSIMVLLVAMSTPESRSISRFSHGAADHHPVAAGAQCRLDTGGAAAWP
jgi:flagellar biosynthesis protein FlhA